MAESRILYKTKHGYRVSDDMGLLWMVAISKGSIWDQLVTNASSNIKLDYDCSLEIYAIPVSPTNFVDNCTSGNPGSKADISTMSALNHHSMGCFSHVST